MAKLKILIIEDDLSFASQMEKMLSKDYKVAPIVSSAVEALSILDKDIMNLVISVSNDEALYERIKGENLLAYLVKPFDPLTLKSIIDLAVDKMGLVPESIDSPAALENQFYQNSFFIRTNKQLVRVNISDIRWIQSDGNYCVVVTQNRRYAIKLSLTKILKKLPPDEFVQSHKQYLVQIKYTTQIDTAAGQLFIGEEVIPVGRKYKAKLFERLGWFV
jgi:DNA-binding LytR/AlgR family response regulator